MTFKEWFRNYDPEGNHLLEPVANDAYTDQQFKIDLAIAALTSLTDPSFHEGADKKECVDLTIAWAKRVLETLR